MLPDRSTPPIAGLPAVSSLSWSIPGLKDDPTMCLRCRSAQLLCGKPVCPILVKYDAFARTLPLLGTKELDGSSPPGLFVGRFGYPKVSLGPLVSPLHGDTLLFDTPEEWVGRSVQEVVSFRTMLVRGTRRFSVFDAEKPIRLVDDVQTLALSSESVETEATFARPPRGNLGLSDDLPPYGPTAPIESIRLNVRRVDQHLDRLASDIHANAGVAVKELYERNVRVSRIQRAFSAGTLGRRGRRKFVPTRWSITAVDDILSKQNLSKVRYLPELDTYRLYRYTALDNRWVVAMLPGAYRYESIEAWYPNTLWNPNPQHIAIMGDHEGFRGRTTYASIGGCYYAARLATSETLLKLGRQAGVVVLREVHPGEILPLGVWNVREHLRAALSQPSESMDSLEELLTKVSETFDIPLSRWVRASSIVTSARTQMTLDRFLTAPTPRAATVSPAR
ncbi:MAG: Nre family DNA repair protein [Thermoplasmata archaeon]|nr:Nre family DNA repair protein [Thermoplasmata archaeon]